MALIDFLNQTCNITSITTTLVWWEEVKTETPVYTWISCYYYKSNANLSESWLAQNTNLSSYKVLLEPNRTNTRRWQFITITDNDLWSIGKYILEDVKVNRLINGSRDSIELTIKSI
jgi:hypothetical protein